MPLVFPTSEKKMEIVIPSDFKLSIGAITDAAGTPIDLSKMHYHYEFSTDGGETIYECSFRGGGRKNSTLIDLSYDCGSASGNMISIMIASDQGVIWDMGASDYIPLTASALLLVFENYTMTAGDLKYREKTATPDANYSDGTENVISKWMATTIKLV